MNRRGRRRAYSTRLHELATRRRGPGFAAGQPDDYRDPVCELCGYDVAPDRMFEHLAFCRSRTPA